MKGSRVAKVLIEFFRQRKSWSEIEREVIDKEMSDLSNSEKIRLLLSCFLEQCGKAFSHLMDGFERYLPLLKKFATDSDSKLEIIDAANHYWSANGDQNLLIFIDRGMSVRLLDNISIVKWIFSKPQLNRFTR